MSEQKSYRVRRARPCPFCGGKNATVCNEVYAPANNYITGWAAGCGGECESWGYIAGCGAMGPVMPTRRGAMAAWNRRVRRVVVEKE